MIKFKELRERCWPGYKRVPGKAAYSPGSCRKEEMGAGAVAGPANVVGGGAIAGTGGKGGEPGVDMRKRRKHNPILMGMTKR
jgi:hypothetical protein